MHKRIDRTGELHTTNQGYPIEIVNWVTSKDCDIMFLNTGLIIRHRQYIDIVNGEIANPYHKSFCGVGYIGVGKYKPNTHPEAIRKWRGMLARCYSEVDLNSDKGKSYKDVTVCEEWQCFQNFAEWFYSKYKDYMKDWELDKDIKLLENKKYSPESCLLIPSEINKILVNCGTKKRNLPLGITINYHKYKVKIKVSKNETIQKSFDHLSEACLFYKLTKENILKEATYKWKNFMDDETYNAIINFEILYK